ncbi:MAG: FG-GAP-like repeat-containing protein, partial [Myxococcales bacterium]
MPERDPAAFLLRQPFLPSGLSVDAAWRYGRGAPSALLALVDDGIDLGEAQLSASFALNPGELQLVPPIHRDGTACARLVPTDQTSPRLDCATPADGMVTVQDFRETLGWVGDIAGTDPNNNGILDPEDIIALYHNDVDDDGNGLVDDIAGWNFAESNNDLRHRSSTHGTEVALDVLAPVNDNKDRAGVCPACLGLPIRVSEQRGTDPQSLALALLYAASRGATAALVGHLPLGRSETLETAIRVAAQHGMLVIFPLDGEYQSHPPALFNTDAWLPVGALTTHNDDNRTNRTISFATLDSSQTLAPGVNLMGSGPTRSRRAQSVVLGVAGLISAGSLGMTTSRLTPIELASILKWSADPIDPSLTSLTESPTADATAMRRVNANAAVEAVRARLIPPEVDLEGPTWHEPIFEEKAASLAVIGRVSAPRAKSLDIQVSMAVGREPKDVDFQPVFRRDELEARSLSNAGSTIATLDPRTFRQTTDASDQQSSAVITIRVRATAHYPDAQEDVSTEVQRAIILLRDPDLILGTPLRIGAKATSPKIADVDGDSVDDIVFGDLDGNLSMLAARGGRLEPIHSPPLTTRQLQDFRRVRSATSSRILDAVPLPLEGLGHSPIVAPPAIADLDSDGNLDVVAASLDGTLYAYKRDGTFLPGWSELSLPEVDSGCAGDSSCVGGSSRLARGLSSSPVIADVNGDGHPEVIVAAHDGKLHAYMANGQPVKGWPVSIGIGPNMQPGRLTQSPAVGDFNFDGIDDLVLTAGEERSREFGRGAHYLLLGTAQNGPQLAEGWPVGVDTIDAIADRLDRSTPPAAVDSSGPYTRTLLYGNSSQPFFLPLNPGSTQETDASRTGGVLPEFAEPVSLLDNRAGFRLSDFGALSKYEGITIFSPMLARPSIGDLDRDAVPDVV